MGAAAMPMVGLWVRGVLLGGYGSWERAARRLRRRPVGGWKEDLGCCGDGGREKSTLAGWRSDVWRSDAACACLPDVCAPVCVPLCSATRPLDHSTRNRLHAPAPCQFHPPHCRRAQSPDHGWPVATLSSTAAALAAMPQADPAAPATSLPEEVITCLQNARFVSEPKHANAGLPSWPCAVQMSPDQP